MSGVKDNIKEYKRLWNAKNADKVRLQNRRRLQRFHEAHPNYDSGQWAKRDPALWRQYQAVWRLKNREKINARARFKRLINRDEINAKRKVARKQNPMWVWRSKQRRRSAELRAKVDSKGVCKFITRIRHKQWVNCYYCGARIAGSSAHIDHIIPINPRSPLAERGNHSMSNLCVACAPCNLSKSDKNLREWDRHSQIFLI